FQAEDGIRDFHVTGVQTCALPISNGHTRARDVRARRGRCETPAPQRRLTCAEPEAPPRPLPLPVAPPVVPPAALRASCAAGSVKIGRASCRGRVEGWSGRTPIEHR